MWYQSAVAVAGPAAVAHTGGEPAGDPSGPLGRDECRRGRCHDHLGGREAAGSGRWWLVAGGTARGPVRAPPHRGRPERDRSDDHGAPVEPADAAEHLAQHDDPGDRADEVRQDRRARTTRRGRSAGARPSRPHRPAPGPPPDARCPRDNPSPSGPVSRSAHSREELPNSPKLAIGSPLCLLGRKASFAPDALGAFRT